MEVKPKLIWICHSRDPRPETRARDSPDAALAPHAHGVAARTVGRGVLLAGPGDFPLYAAAASSPDSAAAPVSFLEPSSVYTTCRAEERPGFPPAGREVGAPRIEGRCSRDRVRRASSPCAF